MRRALLLAAGVALAAPSSASAAPFGEAQYLTVRGDADCARATGIRDELAIPALNGVRFLQATKEGLRLGEEVRIAANFECGAVATRPGGAGVIAGVIAGAIGSTRLAVTIREPGGTWGMPQLISTEGFVREVRASVSARGDVIVAYKEEHDDDDEGRLRVVLRPAGGTLAPPVTVGPSAGSVARVDVGIAATGEAFVLWSTVAGGKPPLQMPVQVAIAPPGGGFGAPVQLGATRLFTPPSLSVAEDGRALVAMAVGDTVSVFERTPGAGFGPPVAVGAAGDPVSTAIETELGRSGEAAIAWARGYRGDVQLVTRPAAGAFSAPVTVLRDWTPFPPGYDFFYASETFFENFATSGSITFPESFGRLVSLTGDGRVTVALAADDEIRVSTMPLTGGAVDTQTLAREGEAVTALLLADGTPAVVWTSEDARGGRFRMHFASPATIERADPPPPRVTVGAPVRNVLTEDRPLRLPITCDGPCEVTVAEPRIGFPGVLRRSRAGTSIVTVGGAYLSAPERLGPVRLRLTYSAPGALQRRSRTFTVRIRRDGGPEPRVMALRAVRDGDRVRVSWRVSGPVADFGAFVSGEDVPEYNGDPIVTRTVEGRKGRRAYSVSLPAAGVKYVVLRVPFLFFQGGKTVVRVR